MADTARSTWTWPIDLEPYNRSPLTSAEAEALRSLGWDVRRQRGYQRESIAWRRIGRLLRPLDDARDVLDVPDERLHRRSADDGIGLILWTCARTETAFWEWTPQAWAELIGADAKAFTRLWPGWIDGTTRPYLAAYAYLLTGFTDFHLLGKFKRLSVAGRVFGRSAVDSTLRQIMAVLDGWGYQTARRDCDKLHTTIAQTLLVNRSPRLEDLSTEMLTSLRDHPAIGRWGRSPLYGVHRAVAALGHADAPPRPNGGRPHEIEGACPEWMRWVDKWQATSTLTSRVRQNYHGQLAKVGRWLAAEQPEITGPADWTRATCATWVARVDRMTIGEFIQRSVIVEDRLGEPLSPRSKASNLNAVRTFLRDCQEWEWIPRRFDPAIALSTPRSIKALIGPKPRVIADDVWAKLLWAGLNLEPADVPPRSGQAYPIELIRAITLTWLFSGQRSDEIARLRVGCVRWQREDVAVPGRPGDVLAKDAVCLLDVPTHKTGTAFTKPVDPILGRAVEAWQAVRPVQPQMLDRKTAERVDFLFAHRARPVAKAYINLTVIPVLCRKAGVPTTDVLGQITSHRARSTIATQLYNAKEPMTLFELQAWLGHRSPETTQHYAKIAPTTLAKAYGDAGYFARNVRTVEVLIDRDAVASGAAASGEPWQHYDLGHGYCTYTFFEQCPHRMACARCDFYTPKGSSKGQLLEAKENLQKMLVGIPLTDDERTAVDDGQAALDHLLERLADVPTPAGLTPRELGLPPGAIPLPFLETDARAQDSTRQPCCPPKPLG
ncbi:tyrosine-type recombinase/integrase [Kitasatospora sp. NPDC096077]|uniref:tyrosine-type recombinase/integrase n=1 Tax=Kitasatospora sp. NPDC096077 TaxID=3155544 RepID=UPI00332D4FC2